ncbi:MAG: DUF2235 domain-containing protein, partial [Polymorphobacter sp.]
MAKTIVICIDGTGDQIQVNPTNVLRLAAVATGMGDAQHVYYDPGVGTQGQPTHSLLGENEVLKLLDLGIGLGIYDKLGNAYALLMAAYRPGDRLMLFGFSRGAYIVRALAGMVAKIGILDPLRANLLSYAVKLYADPRNADLADNFARTFCHRDARINFLGLWDTVKSVFAVELWPPQVSSVSLPFTFNNDKVDVVRHAVSIDEKRRFFRTNLWNPLPGQDVAQIWFAGGHCDIGGSYPPDVSGLSRIALDWMLDEAAAHGLLIDPVRRAALPGTPDACAPMHNRIHGLVNL